MNTWLQWKDTSIIGGIPSSPWLTCLLFRWSSEFHVMRRWIKLHIFKWECPRINSKHYWRMDPPNDALCIFPPQKKTASMLCSDAWKISRQIIKHINPKPEYFTPCWQGFPYNSHFIWHQPKQCTNLFLERSLKLSIPHLLLSLISPKKRVPYKMIPVDHPFFNRKYLVATAPSTWDSKPCLSSFQQKSKPWTYEDKSLNVD